MRVWVLFNTPNLVREKASREGLLGSANRTGAVNRGDPKVQGPRSQTGTAKTTEPEAEPNSW
jgi:hypothetical protein